MDCLKPAAHRQNFLRSFGEIRLSQLGLLLLVGANLVYASLAADRYGQSTDDPGDVEYGQIALRAYVGSDDHLAVPGVYKYYGPFYLMLVGGGSRAIHSLVPSWDPLDIRHFINFLTFQLAIVAFYGLARRMIHELPALLTTAVFATQPLLFGHGFINHKDMPLLAMMTAGMYLGLKLADGADPESGNDAESDTILGRWGLGPYSAGWHSASRRARAALIVVSMLALAVSMDLFFGTRILAFSESVLEAAYTGRAWEPISRLFAAVAEDAYKTPLPSYIAKLEGIFGWVRLAIAFLALLPVWILVRRTIYRQQGNATPSPTRAGLVIPAAIVLGMAISIRTVGVVIGVIISLAVFLRWGRRALLPVLGYWFVALSVSYLTWPYLWQDPIGRFYASARLMTDIRSNFVLFKGAVLSSGELPWDYLPTLLGIQLTEPVVLLGLPGFILLMLGLKRSRRARPLLLAVALWFLAPFLGSTVFRMPLYSNFRQVLFIVPPIVLGTGLSIDSLWVLGRSRWVKLALVFVLLAPGLWGILELRPYEYVYYNRFVGGTKGAEGLFVHDYWCTSYREAVEWVNDHAAAGARIGARDAVWLVEPIAREDLQVFRARGQVRTAQYELECNNRGRRLAADIGHLPVAFAVTRANVVLSLVLANDAGGDG